MKRVRHYLPALVGVVILAVAIAVVPSTKPVTTSGPSITGATPGPIPPPPDAPGSKGTAVSGVKCGPGVRQVPWSKYGPLCQPAYQGTNGGATSPGVTKTTITLTYRDAPSPSNQALRNTLGSGLLPTEAQVTSVIKSYLSVFNKDFEFYGRHVVLKAYTGKGDFLTEDLGKDEAQAQEDADTAKSLGAFADFSLLNTTAPYTSALASQHIISVGGIIQSKTILSQLAPYDYETSPTCQKVSAAGVQIISHALANMPAVYAGTGTTAKKKRVFALLSPNDQSYNQCSAMTVNELKKKYNITPAVDIHYPLTFTNGEAIAENTIAQLSSKHVTTVVCACDPVAPIYLAADGTKIGYHPEWFSINLANAYNRLPTQTQWSHDMAGGNAAVSRARDEAYKVFRMATMHGPLLAAYVQVYEPLLVLLDGIQAAGPDLTPQNFARGLHTLPPSVPGGQFGPWQFKKGAFDPWQAFQVMWWDPKSIDPQDGLKGVYRACNGGQYYNFTGKPTLPYHHQLQCFANAPAIPAGPKERAATAARFPGRNP